jgi:hypothetical protein
MNRFEEKVAKFFASQAVNIVLLIIVAVYALSGLINIQETGKTPLEILASGFIALILAWSISTLLGQKGIVSGQRSDTYKATLVEYGNKVSSVDGHTDEFEKFCEEQKAYEKEKIQRSIIAAAGLKWDKVFIEGQFVEPKTLANKEHRKAIKRAILARVYNMEAGYILGGMEQELKSVKDETIVSFQTQESFKTGFLKVMNSVIFGIYSIQLMQDFNWAAVIWKMLEVSVWMGFGYMSFFTNYDFVIEKYRKQIISKINLIVKFNDIIKKNPKKYLEEIKTNERKLTDSTSGN